MRRELLNEFTTSTVDLTDLHGLYDRILDTVKVEWQVMGRIFLDDPLIVMKRFLDRVFQQLVTFLDVTLLSRL